MTISEGYFYHIKDSFFADVRDNTLMSNKENGAYRPHYLAIKDALNPHIFWMVPVSSRYEKYHKIYNYHVNKYGKCTKIVLGKCGGWNAAFLIQNAFPIIEEYFDHIHTSQGQPLSLHKGTSQCIIENLNHNLLLHKKGVHLFFADIDSIYVKMLDKLRYSSTK